MAQIQAGKQLKKAHSNDRSTPDNALLQMRIEAADREADQSPAFMRAGDDDAPAPPRPAGGGDLLSERKAAQALALPSAPRSVASPPSPGSPSRPRPRAGRGPRCRKACSLGLPGNPWGPLGSCSLGLAGALWVSLGP